LRPGRAGIRVPAGPQNGELQLTSPPAADARAASRARRPRARLAVEIAAVLAVKFTLLYVIWAVWFAQPASSDLDARGVAAAVLGVPPGPSRHQDNPE